jgi:2,3-bisphosphoglycerate-independent phosphoglycerate mutase
MKNIHPTALIILDGFGYSAEKKYNAIAHAYMPHFNAWWQKYPHALLRASGSAVGLPDKMIGNSEVGHLTIGAGRVIDQPMKQWLAAITDGSFADNEVLKKQLERLHRAGGALHIIGLLSDAGIHAHEKQIYAVIEAAIKAGIKKIVVHPILDGRDVPPQSAHHYLKNLSLMAKYYNHGQIIIGSLHGRFYAMDRGNNWDRIEKSYRVLTQKQEYIGVSLEKVLERNYAHNITDEFIPPTQLDSSAIIHNGDGIIFCNVRPDRARELTRAFIENEFHPFVQKPLNLTFFITPVSYDTHLQTTVLFPRKTVHSTLKDILAAQNKTIFSIAESEKYAHVTYFFRGENEDPVATETRKMIHSIPAPDYIQNPEMRASEITKSVLDSLQHNPADFYLINYANADMVGHSGNFGATIKAVEFLDTQLGILYEQIVEKRNGTLYITADHGKAEDMFDEDIRQPRTAHTNNEVPFLMIKNDIEKPTHSLKLDELADIAPFILENMGLPIPAEMKYYGQNSKYK